MEDAPDQIALRAVEPPAAPTPSTAIAPDAGGVAALQASGLKVFGYTATNVSQWSLLESLGVDGIYVDDVSLGLAHQAPVP